MRCYVKNMRGANLRIVQELLFESGIEISIPLQPGEIEIHKDLSREKRHELREKLALAGMPMIFSRKEILCEKVKNLITTLVENTELPRENYSVFIARQLQLSYTYLANTFSEVEGSSIERFLLHSRAAHAASLLKEDKLSLGQIAARLHYSTPGHFSAQFKTMMGMSPLQYRKLHSNSGNE